MSNKKFAVVEFEFKTNENRINLTVQSANVHIKIIKRFEFICNFNTQMIANECQMQPAEV